MNDFYLAIETTAAASLLSCSPILLYGLIKRSKPLLQLSLLAFGLFLLDGIAVHVPQLFGATGMTWAVCGKLLQLAVFLAVARKIKGTDWSRPNAKTWWFWSVLVAGLTLIPNFIMGHYIPPFYSGPWIVYQATLPGLVEEFIYRGVLLVMFDQVLGRPVRWLGVDWGWGAVLTSLYFYLAHCLVILPETGQYYLLLQALPDFALYGVAMCWLRYRFESLWPAILAHNLHNLSLPLLAFLR